MCRLAQRAGVCCDGFLREASLARLSDLTGGLCLPHSPALTPLLILLSLFCTPQSDIAHISGLVAAKVMKNPFEHSDIVTTTTHKSLRGPRGGMIFFKKNCREGVDVESAVNNAVFPALQGGPHNNTIAALAVALKATRQPEFVGYQKQVVSNCRAMAAALMAKGHKLISAGTDNHLVLLDLRPMGLDGARVEKVCDLAHITLNKNSVAGDKSALVPGGVRIGTPALTTRGFTEKDFEMVAQMVDRAIQIALSAKKATAQGKLKEFTAYVEDASTAEAKQARAAPTHTIPVLPQRLCHVACAPPLAAQAGNIARASL